MIKFQNSNMVIIPIAYNIYIKNFENENEIPCFNSENLLERNIINELYTSIDNIRDDVLIGIDMEYISSYTSREMGIVNKLHNKKNIFFYNVSINKIIMKKMQEDLNDIIEIHDSKSICFSDNVKTEIISDTFFNKISIISKDEIRKIVETTVEHKIQFQESSNIYSNMYINLKKLFLNKDAYIFILYSMASEIIKFDYYDALISTSKTGAIFANLLGIMLNKKVVNCVGLGPKFAISIDEIKKNVRPNKKYVYIYDFLCLGTELKMLNALVKSEKATLISGMGVASYINTQNNDLGDNILSKMKNLINILEQGITYKIDVTREGLEKTLGGS